MINNYFIVKSESESESESIECQICTENIQIEKMCQTPCKHDFCQVCWARWKETQPNTTCPICRNPLSGLRVKPYLSPQDAETFNLLLLYQQPHLIKLLQSVQKNMVSLDTSDTGTGKTYTAIALCKMLRLKPFIICPKSVIFSWLAVAKLFEVEIIGISNYEMVKAGNHYTNAFEKVKCSYLTKKEVIIKNKKRITSFLYNQNLPESSIVIFDEAHKCKNVETGNSSIMQCFLNQGIKILLISATLTDKIQTFAVFGVMFGLYEKHNLFGTWIKQQKIINTIKYINNPLFKGDCDNTTSNNISLDIIHNTLFPAFGSRMKIDELGDLFPSNNISSDCYYMENYKKVDEEYMEINYCMNRLKVKEYYTVALGRLIRARQRIELLKLPTFIEIIEEGLENNFSVVVFVNFKETQDQLMFHLKTSCRIAGGQTMEERQANIDLFQTNKSRIIISTSQAGGVGISLHDLDGRFPRMSVISPTWSGQDLVQILGRVHRAGGKSPVIQKIVYCAKSYEGEICKILKKKLKNISAINDGDLYGPMIKEHELNTHLDVEENKYEVISFEELNIIESTGVS